MPGRRSPARLVVALSVAMVLAVFLVYTSVSGGGVPQVSPSELGARTTKVELVGKVAGPVRGDAHSAAGLRFRVRDIGGAKSVPVVYRGEVPDQFKVGRHVVVSGQLRGRVFAGQQLVTKCPSKYTAKKD